MNKLNRSAIAARLRRAWEYVGAAMALSVASQPGASASQIELGARLLQNLLDQQPPRGAADSRVRSQRKPEPCGCAAVHLGAGCCP